MSKKPSVPRPAGTVEPAASPTLVGILTQLGLIITPAAIIAFFCQILDASSRTTGAASLATVLLASICVYRRALNRSVPASLLMALLIGLAAVFFFNYQNILLKDTGLIEYYPHSNDFLGSIDGPIRQAQEDIWFYGTDFSISAGDRRNLLLDKLASGLRLNYLIFDPRSSHLEDLASDFDQSPAELRAECEKGLESLLQLRKEWQDRSKSSHSPGEVNVRIFETHPHARFYVFDSGRTHGRTFFVPYVNGVNSPDVPGFLLANVKNGVFRAYFSSILKMWGESTDLSVYIQQHPEFAGR
jgi:hypothetical protein